MASLLPTSALDPLYNQYQAANTAFGKDYSWNQEAGRYVRPWESQGQEMPGNAQSIFNPESGGVTSGAQYSGFNITDSGNGKVALDIRDAANKAGYAAFGSNDVNIKYLADTYFGGNVQKLLENRFGPDFQAVQDPRFSDAASGNMFIKPSEGYPVIDTQQQWPIWNQSNPAYKGTGSVFGGMFTDTGGIGLGLAGLATGGALGLLGDAGPFGTAASASSALNEFAPFMGQTMTGLDTLGAGAASTAATGASGVGQSFLAANDAVTGFAPLAGSGATTPLVGDLAAGGAMASGVGSSLADFGLNSFGTTGALGPDIASNPFQLPGFDSSSTANLFGPSAGNPFSLPSNPTFNPSGPSGPGDFAPPNFSQGQVTGPVQTATQNIDWSSLASKYGIDAAKAIYQAIQLNDAGRQAKNSAADAARMGNASFDPRRAPFQQAVTDLLQPDAFMNNPRARAIMAQLNQGRDAEYAKRGFNGTSQSKFDVATAAAMSGLMNDELKTLLPYTGFDQNPAQSAAIQYQGVRDNLAFGLQGAQVFSALAAKLGSDKDVQKATGAAYDEAVAFGKQIISWFNV